jgi:hypothetical protein
MIHGTVKVRSQNGDLAGIENVCVSNGREIVRTGADGVYALPQQPEDRFVFVTVPSGYAAIGHFYIDLTTSDGFDFELEENAERNVAEFAFVQVTDIHMSVGGRSVTSDLIEDLAEIDRQVGDRVLFIAATGDLTNLGTQAEFAAYVEAVKTSRLPIYHLKFSRQRNTNSTQ